MINILFSHRNFLELNSKVNLVASILNVEIGNEKAERS